MKTIAKISEDTLTIINYLKDIPHGQYLTYEQIQTDTKVKMDTKGKSYLRTACKKLKREYSPVIGSGIELASAKSATGLVAHRLIRIDKAVKRGEKTYNNVTKDFYSEFTPIEQKQINFIGAAFGAIRVAAENGKHFLKNTTFVQSNNPVLPENIK
jgi:hypothetical protein